LTASRTRVNLALPKKQCEAEQSIDRVFGGFMVRLSNAAAMTAILCALASPAVSQTATTYTYDVHGRLIGSTAGGTATYTYDKAGNRIGVVSTIGSGNIAPSAFPDSLSVPNAGTATVNAVANDTDPDAGDQANLTITNITGHTQGTANIVNSGKSVSYSAYAGPGRTDTITYYISDGRGGTASSQINVTIAPSGVAPPTASAVTTSVAMNSANNVISLNTTNSPTSVAVGTAPAHGTVDIVGTTLRYTPHGGYHGADPFTYTASNAGGTSAAANINLTVKPPAPVAYVDTVSIPYGSAKTFSPIANDSGTQISIVSVTQPSVGSMAHDLGNIWLGDFGTWSGFQSINYTITDPYGQQASSRVDVTVQPNPNPAPVARTDNVTVPYGSAALFQPKDNDSGTGIQITAATQPSPGRTAFDTNNIWVGDMGEGGFTTSFQYTITDSQGRTASATVNVTAQANPNPAPVARNDSVIVPAYSAVLFQPMTNDSGNQTTIVSVTNPPAGRVAYDLGNIWLGDMNGWVGSSQFQYTIQDNQGRTSTATVFFTSQ
jgi:hypothetical protein